MSTRKRGFFAEVNSFVDQNIREIRMAVFGVGAVGVVLIARSIHLVKVYQHMEDIPAAFLKQNVALRGNVKEVTKEGVLKVQHVPVVAPRLPFMKKTGGKNPTSIPVNLACLDLNPICRKWLLDNLPGKSVYFKLLHRDTPNNLLLCAVYSRGRLFKNNISINEDLVKRGLCKVGNYAQSNFVFPQRHNVAHVALMDRLVKLEKEACKKGTGLWAVGDFKPTRRDLLETYKKRIRFPKMHSISKFVKNIWSTTGNLARRLSSRKKTS